MTSHRTLTRIAGVVVVLAALALTALPAAARSIERVDVTVAETFDGSPGTVAAGAFPGCDDASVVTDGDVIERGSLLIFVGTKKITCADGDTISLRYRAFLRGCEASNRGYWRVTGGTGDYVGLRGAGVLAGSYPDGDSCTATSVDDRYRGVLVLP